MEVVLFNKYIGGIYEFYGRGWLIKFSVWREVVLMVDVWNIMKIKVKGDWVIIWFNGKCMVRIKDEKIGMGEGGICF